ncbi:hypothetical protein L195_g048244, partial [Trifolium pratense]
DTFFWTDPWVDGTSLRERFGRLFDLAENKSASVADMFMQGWRGCGGVGCGRGRRSCWESLLTSQDAVTLDAASGLIWHRQISLKANHHCVSGCGEIETAQHLFLSCSTFGALWPLVSSWFGSSLVTAQTPSDHFVQFTYSVGGPRARRYFLQLIWLVVVWVVWTERNHRLFRGSANSVHHMFGQDQDFFLPVVESD